MRKDSYTHTVKIVSALLYSFDPGGMGASVFAPEDEYDDPASSLVGASRKADDLDELVQGRYPAGNPQMLSAIVSAIELFLQATESPPAES